MPLVMGGSPGAREEGLVERGGQNYFSALLGEQSSGVKTQAASTGHGPRMVAPAVTGGPRTSSRQALVQKWGFSRRPAGRPEKCSALQAAVGGGEARREGDLRWGAPRACAVPEEELSAFPAGAAGQPCGPGWPRPAVS